MQRAARMKREMQLFSESPPHGISCWNKNDSIEELEARIIGTDDTPYAQGVFKLEIHIPERYPFEPPKMKFVTPIYHPNIDSGGRICLDSLKMPPKGAWRPALNVSTVLTSIQQLMNEPNPDDPLMTDISEEYQFNKGEFLRKARQWTQKYAMEDSQMGNKENTCKEFKDTKTGDATKRHKQSEDSDSESSDEDDIPPRKRVLLTNYKTSAAMNRNILGNKS
ncbi:unnamed protein product [Owenia fusiformis]|uniref:Ubiquitin-conjugating enzyme E2 T n=1 Tax=Owenia fusiformis TaxID=6347 RepID=A0A8S4P0G6_OWEFU|nr:unnamed protein product [Owenia fusiformis]